MSATSPQKPQPNKPVTKVLREVTHPALIPGIGVEDTGKTFSTNWTVFGDRFHRPL